MFSLVAPSTSPLPAALIHSLIYGKHNLPNLVGTSTSIKMIELTLLGVLRRTILAVIKILSSLLRRRKSSKKKTTLMLDLSHILSQLGFNLSRKWEDPSRRKKEKTQLKSKLPLSMSIKWMIAILLTSSVKLKMNKISLTSSISSKKHNLANSKNKKNSSIYLLPASRGNSQCLNTPINQLVAKET